MLGIARKRKINLAAWTSAVAATRTTITRRIAMGPSLGSGDAGNKLLRFGSIGVPRFRGCLNCRANLCLPKIKSRSPPVFFNHGHKQPM
jgi:hypothetical protein